MEVTTNREAELANAPAPSGSDLQNWAGNWIWRAVQTLVRAPDFNASPKWIAARLNISIEKAVDALEGVERRDCRISHCNCRSIRGRILDLYRE